MNCCTVLRSNACKTLLPKWNSSYPNRLLQSTFTFSMHSAIRGRKATTIFDALYFNVLSKLTMYTKNLNRFTKLSAPKRGAFYATAFESFSVHVFVTIALIEEKNWRNERKSETQLTYKCSHGFPSISTYPTCRCHYNIQVLGLSLLHFYL